MDIKATGIDISKFQTIDWDALESAFKAGKLRFIIMRAGYGYTTIDPKFEDNYAQATKRGIPCGAYWYAYWGNGTPTQEAQAFLAATVDKTFSCGLWYDVEYERNITALSKIERTDKVLEALDTIHASGRYVGLYASTDMINNRLEYGRLSDYDIWVAQYGTTNTCKAPYGMWQYTSGGTMHGIAGRVDCDRAYKDYPAIVTGKLALCSSASEAPTVPEATPPRTTKTLRIGPMTGGDLKTVLDKAAELGLYRVGIVDIGPMTEGDTATMEALAQHLGLNAAEV